MAKKKKKRERAVSNGIVVTRSEGPASREGPRIVFAVGDADWGYTESKIWRLAKRLQEQTGWNIVAMTHDQEALREACKLGLYAESVGMDSPGVTVNDRLVATDEMIREAADLNIPGSQLPLWKVIAMDDFLASLQLFGAQPVAPLQADAVIVPLIAVDNNTKQTCGLYTWLVSEARRQGIPVVGLEVSPLGNKHTLTHLPADHYAVKTEWSKEFLVNEGLARAEQISVLRSEESYLLRPGVDDHIDAYLDLEAKSRELLHVPYDRFTIFIPHHVAFFWEVRKILEALAQVPVPMSVVIRVDPRTIRRQYPERELAMETYSKELRALPHAVLDEQVGVGLLLQLADLVISPFAGTSTERASQRGKPTIVCQAMAQEGWRGEFLYWEPRPEKIPDLIQAWMAKGWLRRTRLARIVGGLVKAGAQSPSREDFAVSDLKTAMGANGVAQLMQDSL